MKLVNKNFKDPHRLAKASPAMALEKWLILVPSVRQRRRIERLGGAADNCRFWVRLFQVVSPKQKF